jgi:hypothetical protein
VGVVERTVWVGSALSVRWMAVWDTDPKVPPAFREGAVPSEDAEHGRGLYLVRAGADATGVSVVLREWGASKGGKLLWAECGEAR